MKYNINTIHTNIDKPIDHRINNHIQIFTAGPARSHFQHLFGGLAERRKWRYLLSNFNEVAVNLPMHFNRGRWGVHPLQSTFELISPEQSVMNLFVCFQAATSPYLFIFTFAICFRFRWSCADTSYQSINQFILSHTNSIHRNIKITNTFILYVMGSTKGANAPLNRLPMYCEQN